MVLTVGKLRDLALRESRQRKAEEAVRRTRCYAREYSVGYYLAEEAVADRVRRVGPDNFLVSEIKFIVQNLAASLGMRRNTTNDFILPSLREALHARGETAHIEVQSDVVRVRCSNGKEAWVNKILWLDALGDQRHNSEAELSQGLIFALLGAKQVPEKQVPELSAATVSSGSWTYATEQPMGLRSLLQQTISSGRALLRGDRA